MKSIQTVLSGETNMINWYEDGWFFEDEEGFLHGPFETKEKAELKCAERLQKMYVKIYE